MRPVDRVGAPQVAAPVTEFAQLLASLVLGVATDFPVQSAPAERPQYTAPGTRSSLGTEICSTVFAKYLDMLEVDEHGAVGGVTALPHGVPSAGPPESYTTWVPVFLYRVASDSMTYQLNSGNTSLKPALPDKSVLLKFE